MVQRLIGREHHTGSGQQVRDALRTEASVRLRGGDLAAVAVYDWYGRIRGADEDVADERRINVAGRWSWRKTFSLSSGRCSQSRHVRPSRPSERSARSPWLGQLTFGRPARSVIVLKYRTGAEA
jgi:hypothetical protein